MKLIYKFYSFLRIWTVLESFYVNVVDLLVIHVLAVVMALAVAMAILYVTVPAYNPIWIRLIVYVAKLEPQITTELILIEINRNFKCFSMLFIYNLLKFEINKINQQKLIIYLLKTTKTK